MKKYNYRFKKIQNIIALEEEEKAKFIENFNELKYKINPKDALNIDDWSSYKKKDNFIMKNFKKKKIEKNPLKLNNNRLHKMIFNILVAEKIKKLVENFFKNKFININFIIEKFLKINIKKINIIKNKNYFKIKNIIFFVIDMRSLKSKLIVFNNKKCLITMSNGIMFKKMQFNNKKYKKSEKLTFLALKNILLKVNFFKKFNNIIIHIKGSKNSTNAVINYLDKNINNNKIKKTYNKKIIYINDYRMSFNKYFKFKKIKAIKRKLKKKFVKSN